MTAVTASFAPSMADHLEEQQSLHTASASASFRTRVVEAVEFDEAVPGIGRPESGQTAVFSDGTWQVKNTFIEVPEVAQASHLRRAFSAPAGCGLKLHSFPVESPCSTAMDSPDAAKNCIIDSPLGGLQGVPPPPPEPPRLPFSTLPPLPAPPPKRCRKLRRPKRSDRSQDPPHKARAIVVFADHGEPSWKYAPSPVGPSVHRYPLRDQGRRNRLVFCQGICKHCINPKEHCMKQLCSYEHWHHDVLLKILEMVDQLEDEMPGEATRLDCLA
ncbi:unnamed protein product [Durusdinium trenchii]|uniref:Uncharacterized protein n=1 Tax=Durusdinium trenchii TaxID=1381693 RepID=A0ABP0S3J4_9DINO